MPCCAGGRAFGLLLHYFVQVCGDLRITALEIANHGEPGDVLTVEKVLCYPPLQLPQRDGAGGHTLNQRMLHQVLVRRPDVLPEGVYKVVASRCRHCPSLLALSLTLIGQLRTHQLASLTLAGAGAD